MKKEGKKPIKGVALEKGLGEVLRQRAKLLGLSSNGLLKGLEELWVESDSFQSQKGRDTSNPARGLEL